jgi:hypothetical protein
MGLVEVLSKFRNFDNIGLRKKNYRQHGSLASLLSPQSGA